MRWLFLITPPADGATNMALDEALMRRAAQSGDGVFRVYSWSAPTLSLGRNQRARGCYNEDVAQKLGVAFVRRPTGGRALLHHREITYSVTLPLNYSEEARTAYAFINDVLLAGLARLGVRAGRPVESATMPPGLRPCFDVPAEHEIAVNGRKLVGSAQLRRDGALLQHGSILIRDDQGVIQRLLSTPIGNTPEAATLAESLGYEPSVHEVAQPILDALEAATSRAVEPFDVDPGTHAAAEGLRQTYYDPAWTWRR